ncbi:hypothetical protein VN12_08320 [Pirellula sp. SH-Sr6A]|nr:hypothetical protein VN12_08320 [Pirellula sp. SH-Sr6A]
MPKRCAERLRSIRKGQLGFPISTLPSMTTRQPRTPLAGKVARQELPQRENGYSPPFGPLRDSPRGTNPTFKTPEGGWNRNKEPSQSRNAIGKSQGILRETLKKSALKPRVQRCKRKVSRLRSRSLRRAEGTFDLRTHHSLFAPFRRIANILERTKQFTIPCSLPGDRDSLTPPHGIHFYFLITKPRIDLTMTEYLIF